MANVYAFRGGRSVRGCDPQRVGETLERIRREKGALQAPDVVEAAREADSPIHAAFEWDDGKAAEEYRLIQARRLIVSVRVLNSPIQGDKAPAFVSVRTPDKGRAYVPTVEAMSDEQMAARVLAEVRQFIESMERRYAGFRQAQEVLSNLRKAAG